MQRPRDFDRIARLAAQALAAPLAVVACGGRSAVFSRAPIAAATVLAQSLSAVPRGQGVLVADTAAIAAEPRFNELHQALPEVVALAAAPIRACQEQPAGLIAVMDTAPRVWSPTDAAVLEDFAALAAPPLGDDGFERSEAVLRAEEASRAKSAFLANLAHEVRTPLNAILGYAQLLRRSRELAEEQRDQVQVIYRSGEHLLRLVNDVIDLSRIEAGKDHVRPSEVDLPGLLADLHSMFLVQATAKNLSFSVEQERYLPRAVVIDEGKLRQILVNLVGNAIKFTRQGRVVVRPRFRAQGDGGRLAFDVADTGPGIDPELAERLFQPFSRGTTSPASESSGLGLALSRDLARLLGGDLSLVSSTSEGSLFCVEVPIRVVSRRVESAVAPSRGHVVGLVGSADILIVDDDPPTLSWLRRLLSDCGFDVRETTHAAASLAIDRRRPDLVLMNVSVRGEHGYDSIRAIRGREGAPFLLALAASALDSDRERALGAGANGWLPKPCREPDLLDELRRLLGVEYIYATPARGTIHPPARSSAGPSARLPSTLARPMAEAAERADHDRLTELIAEIPRGYESLVEELEQLVTRYAYDEIQERLLENAAIRS